MLRTSRSLLQSLSISERIRPSGKPGGQSDPVLQCKGASLLGLPVELRVIILSWALGDAYVRLRHAPRHRRRERRNAWALLQICHRVRLEMKPTFFQTATFTILRDTTEQKLSQWLATIGPEAVSDLRKLEFDCESQCALLGLRSGLDYCVRKATVDLSPSQNYSNQEDMPSPVHLVQLCSNKCFTCINRTKARLFAEGVTDLWRSRASCPQKEDILSIWRALNQNNSGRKGEWSRLANGHEQESRR
jgi:hypothetical protein